MIGASASASLASTTCTVIEKRAAYAGKFSLGVRCSAMLPAIFLVSEIVYLPFWHRFRAGAFLNSVPFAPSLTASTGHQPGASRCSSHEEICDADTVEASAEGACSLLPATCSPPGSGRSVPQAGSARPMPGGMDRAGSSGLASRAHTAPRTGTNRLPLTERLGGAPQCPALFYWAIRMRIRRAILDHGRVRKYDHLS